MVFFILLFSFLFKTYFAVEVHNSMNSNAFTFFVYLMVISSNLAFWSFHNWKRSAQQLKTATPTSYGHKITWKNRAYPFSGVCFESIEWFLVTVSGICSTHGFDQSTDETQRQLQTPNNWIHWFTCTKMLVTMKQMQHSSKTKGNEGIKCLVSYGHGLHFHSIDHTALHFIHLFTHAFFWLNFFYFFLWFLSFIFFCFFMILICGWKIALRKIIDHELLSVCIKTIENHSWHLTNNR